MRSVILAKLFHSSQSLLHLMPLEIQVKLLSFGRKYFMEQFNYDMPKDKFVPSEKYAVKAWGLNFRSPIMNSAGMFKNGDAYDVVQQLGAGAYLGGTSTFNPRLGNSKNNCKLPFISLPKSAISLNWLGLPNLGDEILAHKNLTFNKVDDCPIGWSVMRSPDFSEHIGLDNLITSLWKYHDHPQIDFIEINESCPNIKHSAGNIIKRLQIIAQEFLLKRKRNLPIIIKLSNDVSYESLEEVLSSLISLGYDGINLGNTSTNYAMVANNINNQELALYNYFTKEFGGGIGGSVLKENSLRLCVFATNFIKSINPAQEFHVIRSGGIESLEDIVLSLENGVTLVQWYTGFFNQFHISGENIYRDLLK